MFLIDINQGDWYFYGHQKDSNKSYKLKSYTNKLLYMPPVNIIGVTLN